MFTWFASTEFHTDVLGLWMDNPHVSRWEAFQDMNPK